jgi:hypothetical protein
LCTSLPNACAAECPELAKADIRLGLILSQVRPRPQRMANGGAIQPRAHPASEPACHPRHTRIDSITSLSRDGRDIGRLYEDRQSRPEYRWFWSITTYVDPTLGIVTSGRAPTIEEAKA